MSILRSGAMVAACLVLVAEPLANGAQPDARAKVDRVERQVDALKHSIDQEAAAASADRRALTEAVREQTQIQNRLLATLVDIKANADATPPWRSWFLGLVSGVIGATFGFFLRMWWESWKDKQERVASNSALQNVVTVDLASNSKRIRRNIEFLNHELPMLPQRSVIIAPLALMRTGFWEIIKLQSPSKFVTVEEMAALHNLFDIAEEANEQIRSREAYRNNNAAMSTFPDIMKIHDEVLLKTLSRLDEAIAAANTKKSEHLGVVLG
jgi:hypothetical protein